MLDKIVVLCNTSSIKILLIMYKIIGFATIQAIALWVALNFGQSWLFAGIGFFMLCEYCYFASYDVKDDLFSYEEKIANSRAMIFVHTAWFLCTVIIAIVLGVFNGYEFVMEVPVGHSFEYKEVYQEGHWLLLVIWLGVRMIEQKFIENAIANNIKLFKDRNRPKAV